VTTLIINEWSPTRTTSMYSLVLSRRRRQLRHLTTNGKCETRLKHDSLKKTTRRPKCSRITHKRPIEVDALAIPSKTCRHTFYEKNMTHTYILPARLLAIVVCLSMSLCITRRYCIETAQRIGSRYSRKQRHVIAHRL